MKKLTLIGLVTAMLATGVARASISISDLYTYSVNTVIPAASPVGVTFSETVSGIPSGLNVQGVTVTLNITGGYNGNLFAYLVAPNGTEVTLMNMPGVSVNGFGASGAGLNNVTLEDGAANGTIQNVTSGSVLTGTYSAAGSLAALNGSAADGTWTLYFAELGSGGGPATLTSWSLGLEVPEQANAALAVLLGLLALHWSLGKFWGRRKIAL